jgi:hypothetical protein
MIGAKYMSWSVIALAVTMPALPVAAKNPSETNASIIAMCEKNVSAIGTSMGHSETKSDTGRPLIEFVVRSGAGDYAVMCDAETGLVTDIGPVRG